MGVYSQTPPKNAFKVDSPVHQIKNKASILNQNALGNANIETFTVIHNRSGKPKKAIIIARTQDRERCLATTDNKPETLQRLMNDEAVGQPGKLFKKGNKTHFAI